MEGELGGLAYGASEEEYRRDCEQTGDRRDLGEPVMGGLYELDVVQGPGEVEDDEDRPQDEDVADARDHEGLHAGVGGREHLVGGWAS